mmetsp:Transcript_57994/g.154162  ORF Transcript_57994/g.154162 Transcript_57994/m.154162 type:complete len:219 (-) Transcript_57994:251-907(-)
MLLQMIVGELVLIVTASRERAPSGPQTQMMPRCPRFSMATADSVTRLAGRPSRRRTSNSAAGLPKACPSPAPAATRRRVGQKYPMPKVTMLPATQRTLKSSSFVRPPPLHTSARSLPREVPRPAGCARAPSVPASSASSAGPRLATASGRPFIWAMCISTSRASATLPLTASQWADSCISPRAASSDKAGGMATQMFSARQWAGSSRSGIHLIIPRHA